MSQGTEAKYKSLGCHVFAGGFSMGVKEVMEVTATCEIHNLGGATIESIGMEFFRGEDWPDWYDRKDLWEGVCFLHGNPRCTGFSCVTAGYDESAHGAWSKPTKDLHQLCEFGVKAEFPVICWESVQQAYTVGRPLLDYLRDELFIPNGYRIVHLFLNAASWGNAQHRRRYFFLAYKSDKNFNIIPPTLPEIHTTVGDVLKRQHLMMRHHHATPLRFKAKTADYTGDNHHLRTPQEELAIPIMPQGWCMNRMGRRKLDELYDVAPDLGMVWDCRNSDMPFSMHAVQRLHPDRAMPVISGSSGRYVHPDLNRTLTIAELSDLMGWPIIPKGPDPFGQLGKGIVPACGKWLAEQVVLYMEDHWSHADWESNYDERKGMWEGRHFDNDTFPPPEKVINMTTYCPEKPVAAIA